MEGRREGERDGGIEERRDKNGVRDRKMERWREGGREGEGGKGKEGGLREGVGKLD